MQQIRCEGDTGPHGQTAVIIGPEPLEFEETPTKVENGDDPAPNPQQQELVN